MTTPATPAPTTTAPASAPQKPAAVELIGVSKYFPAEKRNERIEVVSRLSLTIPDSAKGEFVAVLGPSGCGKSTVLNMISGLLMPDEGEIHIYGKQLTGPNDVSVTVPQSYTCFPWLTALGNVEFGLAIQGKPPEERRRIATEYLQKVGLGDRLNAYPRQLSGGMKQRVAIARTLAVKPSVVLMDEPFGALDAQIRSEMQQMLLKLWEAENNLILFITHDITEALLLADRIIVFSPRPARVIRDLMVPFPRPRPASLLFDKSFIEYTQLLLALLKQQVPESSVRVTV